MSRIWSHVHQWFVPSLHNDHLPHLIAERGLLILFALVLGAEGFLVSNVLSTEAGTPSLAAVSPALEAASLPPVIGPVSIYWYERVVLPISRLAAYPGAGRIALLILACTGAVLMGIIALTLSMRRRHYKPVGYVAGGTMLALVTTLLFFNAHVLFPSAALHQVASAVNSGAANLPVAETSTATSGQQGIGESSLVTNDKTR